MNKPFAYFIKSQLTPLNVLDVQLTASVLVIILAPPWLLRNTYTPPPYAPQVYDALIGIVPEAVQFMPSVVYATFVLG